MPHIEKLILSEVKIYYATHKRVDLQIEVGVIMAASLCSFLSFLAIIIVSALVQG